MLHNKSPITGHTCFCFLPPLLDGHLVGNHHSHHVGPQRAAVDIDLLNETAPLCEQVLQPTRGYKLTLSQLEDVLPPVVHKGNEHTHLIATRAVTFWTLSFQMKATHIRTYSSQDCTSTVTCVSSWDGHTPVNENNALSSSLCNVTCLEIAILEPRIECDNTHVRTYVAIQ